MSGIGLVCLACGRFTSHDPTERINAVYGNLLHVFHRDCAAAGLEEAELELLEARKAVDDLEEEVAALMAALR